MSLFITSLNSGSNGNCYYIGNEHEAILVDVGISCRETEKRMKRLGLSIQKVKGDLHFATNTPTISAAFRSSLKSIKYRFISPLKHYYTCI